jgi:hypothetical protein
MRASIVAFVAFLSLSAGCINTSPQFHFPADIDPLCVRSRDNAKAAIIMKGTPLSVKFGATVYKHTGERFVGGEWAWYDPTWKLYVCGMCYGQRIETGCNPVSSNQVSEGVTTHEFAHYWLITNYSDYSHNRKYAGCFERWNDPAGALVSSKGNPEEFRVRIREICSGMGEGEHLGVVQVDGDGNKSCVDFVVVKQ